MMKGHEKRHLAAMVVSALVLTGALSAQGPGPASSPLPETASAAPTPTPVQAAPAAAPAPTIIHSPDATPEQIGDSLMAHQRYQAAIEQYKKAPPTAEVWNKMGVAYQLMFNLDDAADCYQKANKLDPKNAVVINNLGTVYVSLKQFSKAEKAYRKALKLDPKSALVHKNLGTALLAEHKYKKGWQEYQEALADDPEIFKNTSTVRVENPASVQDRGAMNYYMAKGCVRAGQLERAIELLRMAINEGFTTPKKIAADIEFARLLGTPAFQEMVAAQTAQ